VLRLDAACPGEDHVGFFWVCREESGLFGEPIPLPGGERRAAAPVDLREFPQWRGTITHLALAFGTRGDETLRLRALAIDENDPDRPFVRATAFGFEKPINRAGGRAAIRVVLEHAGGPPLRDARAAFSSGSPRIVCPPAPQELPAIGPGERCTILREVELGEAGPAPIELAIEGTGQTLRRTLRVDDPLGAVDWRRGDPAPPAPRPVATDYQIGVYYCPGWSPDQRSRWEKQREYPERDPVLGWYEEGNPAVADWHIRWALENGITFFVYDWYWQDGKEVLTAGLNDGFLEAQYRDRLRFAVMWANHPPFSNHTAEQLAAVTDYWVERYFKRPNYLTVDGKVYVNFFAPAELLRCMGSAETVRAAFEAMRARVRAAGLAGLHIGACIGPDPATSAAYAAAGFDSITAYNYLRTGAATRQSSYRQFMRGHEAIWRGMRAASALPYVPVLTVGWDARPWHGQRTERKFCRRTEDFAEGLQSLRAYLDASGGRMAILEAWNEWGEGSYIEPNAEFGFEDLEAIRAVFARPGPWPQNLGPGDLGLDGAYDLRDSPR
jgi:hypothetical protein